MAVTSTNNLRQGSSGSDVKELQKLLNQNGYKLTEDGIFGDNTLKAVKDYQTKNNLTVDGVVGTNTWGSLTKNKTGSSGSTSNSQADASGFTYKAYEDPDIVKQAKAALEQHLSNKPGEFQYAQQAGWNEIINKINNREKFSYDLNGDALYQQYKDQAVTQGKLASMDVMGQVAAMTGGYGNSYAQTAGQQAYQGYLHGLNDKIPELYQLALDQYNREGDDLYNQYALHADQYERAYGEHRNTISDYNTELSRLTEDARYKAEDAYSKWADDMSFGYQQYRDTVADDQWKQTFDEGIRQWNESMDLQKKSSVLSGNPYDDDSRENKYTPNPGWNEQTIREFQKTHKITVDGKWGPETAAAYDKDPSWNSGNGEMTYSEVKDQLDDWIAMGKSKSFIIESIRDAVADGFITQNQAQKLLDLYVPKGNTY